MSAQRLTGGRVLALSNQLYRALLLAYPPAFRRAYGPELAQVFRTCCREAMRQGGAPAVLRLWPRVLGDLALTALQERIGGFTMSRSNLIRWGSLAAILGSVYWLLYFLSEYGTGLFWYLVLHQPLQEPPLAFVLGYPVIWVLFAIALVGLYLRLDLRPRWLGALGFVLALAGMLALLVGNTGMNYIWMANSGIRHDLSAPRSFIMRYDTLLYTLAFASYLVLGAGMTLLGALAVATRALPRYNGWLLWMGILAGLQYFFTNMGAPSLLNNTGTLGLVVMAAENLAFFVIWSIGWFLLGRLLWSERAAVPAPTIAPPPGAGVA